MRRKTGRMMTVNIGSRSFGNIPRERLAWQAYLRGFSEVMAETPNRSGNPGRIDRFDEFSHLQEVDRRRNTMRIRSRVRAGVMIAVVLSRIADDAWLVQAAIDDPKG